MAERNNQKTETMQTPYYEADEGKLDQDIVGLRNAMDRYWGSRFIAACSVKTNSLPWLLNHFREQGFYAEVVSSAEYDLIKRLGFPAAHVIYNGPIKDKDLFFQVLRDGGMVNLDSSQELEWLEEAAYGYQSSVSVSGTPGEEVGNAGDGTSDCAGILRIGLRVNIDFHRLVPEEVPADAEGSRFGYCEENGELSRVIRRIRKMQECFCSGAGTGRNGPDAGRKAKVFRGWCKGIRIAGLHLHSSTKSRSVKAYAAAAEFAGEIALKYGLTEEIEYIDMGGGYYGGVPGKPTFDDYLPAIVKGINGERKGLSHYFDREKVTLIMEPGVSMVSSSFSFVTSVRDIKRIGEHVYVVIDGSRLNLNPQVTRRWYPHHFEYKSSEERPILSSQEIVGATCMEYDRLFEIKNEPELRVGDRVVFDRAGGYTLCLTPLFIHYYPAVYVKKKDGSLFTAREPWTNEEFLHKNYW